MKKRIASLICVAALALSTVLAGCGNSTNNAQSSSQQAAKETEIKVAALKGPTAMGMVKLMDQSEKNETKTNKYKFTISAAPDELTPSIVQGNVDIAAVPANLAAVLSKKTEGKVQVLAINTLGVLYIVENGDSVKSVADLKGKTIYASGKGSTPEYALNYMLSANGIDPAKDVTIEYKSEHAECVSALANDKNGVAMLPQPFVTVAQTSNDKIRVAIDMTKEWEAAAKKDGKDTTLCTGVVIARTEFVKNNPEAVKLFMEQYKESVKFTNDSVDEAATLIEKYDIVKAAVAKKAIPYCNITCIDGADMKAKLGGYLENLFKQNPQSVGGEVPGDGFYFIQ